MPVPPSVLDLVPIGSGGTARRSAQSLGRARAARGAARIRASLVRRASRHAGDRQLLARNPHRAHCLGDVAHPCRIRRHHAAQSCAARASPKRFTHSRRCTLDASTSASGARPAPTRSPPARCIRSTPNSSRRSFRSSSACRAVRCRPIIPSARSASSGGVALPPIWILGSSGASAASPARSAWRLVRASLQPRAARAGGTRLSRELQAFGAVS